MTSTKKSTIFGASRKVVARGYDILGNIAIVKFVRGIKQKDKKRIALEILKKQKNIRTILEKTGKFKGRLRKLETRFIVGEKTKEALYRENSCEFRFNVDDCYFSSRLSTDREEIAKQVLKSKKKEKVLVMFSGIGVYGIVIGKLAGKKVEKIVCVELSRECNKYALENVRRNKLQEKVEIIQGDVRRVIGKEKSKRVNSKFDRIVMARPNLKDDFLDVAFSVSKKGTIIHYHSFYHELEKKAGVIEELIEKRARENRRKVKIIEIKKAGEIAPYKYRWRADLKIMK